MLSGVTVYAPLRKYINRPGCQVAVLGVGGLGHLAVQFANKMGADVRPALCETRIHLLPCLDKVNIRHAK